MSFMANGYYDAKIDAPFTPFVGLGLGFINADISGGGASGSDTALGYQLLLGGSYPLNKQINLDIAYKFQSTFSDFEDSGAKISYSNSSFLFGARYNF